MTRTTDGSTELPAGFPRCAACPFLRTGPIKVCVNCAGERIETLSGPRCVICRQTVDAATGTCRNRLCSKPDRKIGRVDAVAVLSGPLQQKIHAYKYDGKWGWSVIFGRLVLGHLQEYWPPSAVDLIVANPTYRPPGAPGIGNAPHGHTELVLAAARKEDVLREYPFSFDVIVKTGETPKSASGTYAQKAKAAEALRQVLHIPDPAITTGRRIMVYDDVCATGLQFDSIADHLITVGGAAQVFGLALARAPWAT